MTVCGDIYHYRINLGINLVEAVNYITVDYDLSGPLYTPCFRKIEMYLLNDLILPSDLKRDKLRLFNINTKWEYNAQMKVTPTKVATKVRILHKLKRPIKKRIRNLTASQKAIATRSKVAAEQPSKPPVCYAVVWFLPW